ncbi:MAG TPA: hypothetical protein VFQ61_18200 [Polyangiaceae bacterium]|nr:hypothetical protein [Polyangiaceae bacterium]
MAPAPRFVWADTGSFRIMVHGEEPPTDEEWARFMAATVREVEGQLRAPERKGAVIYSLGGMATPKQRRELQRLQFAGPPPTLVLMSDSRFARGVATALGWLMPSLKNFHALALQEVEKAASLLSAHAGERSEFKHVLAELLRELQGSGPPASSAREWPRSVRPGDASAR